MRNSVFVILVFLMAFFQNCANGIQVDDINLQKSSLGDLENVDSGPGLPIPPSYSEIKKSCEQARALGILKTKTVNAAFPNPNKVCAWELNGNLSTQDGFIRARTEQAALLDLTIGAKVCTVKMSNLTQTDFYYDDNIFITLNGFILASTSDFTRHLSQTNGYYKYEWSQLKDKSAQNSKDDTALEKQYCAGKSAGLSNCSFPKTETFGTIETNFNDEVIQNILAMTSNAQVKLGLVTTGDNNSTDCQHVSLDFAVEVEYYE